MNGSLIRSRFRNVYIGLVVVWLAACLGVTIVIDSFVVPKLLQSRVQAVESLIRSHREALLFDNNRSIRDELLKNGVISEDQAFNEIRPGRTGGEEQIKTALRSCQFITSTSCVNPTQAIILSEPGTDRNDRPSFAIALKTTYFAQIDGVLFWKFVLFLSFAMTLGLVTWAIRQQENFLLNRIALLAAGFTRIERSFEQDGKPAYSALNSGTLIQDEFIFLSQSLDQAAALLEKKTGEIDRYKRQFEKKTELEQLAKTISYSSHNLKAPFLEGHDFFKNLPRYLQSMPQERLLKMGDSLGKRFSLAAESLQQALKATRESYTKPERVHLGRLLRSFEQSVRRHLPNSTFNLTLNIESDADAAQIICSEYEMDAALWNLLRNSLDAKSDATIQVRCFLDSPNSLVIHYRDNGPGIPEFLRERVFEDFYSTKPSGAGLGLGSVRNTLQKSGGTIEINPNHSDGAFFEIRIPLVKRPLCEAQLAQA